MTKIRNPKLEIRNKCGPNSNTKFPNGFWSLHYLMYLELFRISDFEFRAWVTKLRCPESRRRCSRNFYRSSPRLRRLKCRTLCSVLDDRRLRAESAARSEERRVGKECRS